MNEHEEEAIEAHHTHWWNDYLGRSIIGGSILAIVLTALAIWHGHQQLNRLDHPECNCEKQQIEQGE